MPRVEDYEAAIGGPVETIAEQPPEALTPEPAPAPQYEATIGALRDEQKQTVQGALFVGQKSDPERRAKAIALSQQIHMPADFVERHYDDLIEQAKPKLDVDQLVDQNPRVSKYLESIDNAALSHDDLDSLKKIEDGHNAFTRYAGDLGNATKTGFRQLESSGYNGAALYGLHDPDQLAEKAAESNRMAKALRAQAPDYVTEFHKAWEQPGKALDEKARDFRKSVTALADGFTMEKLKSFGKEGGETAQDLAELLYVAAQRPKATSYIIAENLANSLPTLALEAAGTVGGAYAGAYAGAALGTAAGPLGSIAGMVAGAGIGAAVGRGGASFVGNFATEVGGYVNEELEKSGVDITDPKALAAAYKNPVLMTRIRGEAERKGLTIATTSALFAGLAGKFTAAGNSLPSKALRAGTEVAVGGLEEGTGEYLGDAAAKKDFDKSSAANAALEGVAGMGQAAGTVGMSVATDALSAVAPGEKKNGGTPPPPPSGDPVKAAQEAAAKYVQAIQVLDQADSVTKMAEAVREAKTTGRIPEKIAELIDGDEPNSHVYFQADAWDAYWISKGLSPVTMANELTGDGGQAYQNAKDTGAPLEVSMGQYLAKIAPTEHLEGLFPATRTTPDGMTFEEAKQFDQQLPVLMEAIAKEAQGIEEAPAAEGAPSKAEQKKKARASARQVEKQIQDQLVQVGMSPAEAKSNAVLTSSIFRTLGERFNLDPMELFAKYGLQVRGPEQAAADGTTMEQESPVGGPEKKIYPLDPARDARAKELGFDTTKVWYHGSARKGLTGFEPDRSQSVPAVFFTQKKELADEFGKERGDAPSRYAVYLKTEKTFDYEDAGAVDELVASIPEDELEHAGATLIEGVDHRAQVAALIRNGDYSVIESPPVFEALEKAGFDSFFVKEQGEKNIGVFDAAQIRSVDANFDLEEADSANIYHQSNLPVPTPTFQLSPLGFFSQLEREVGKMDFKSMPAKDLAGRIKNLPGIKAEELEWTGLLDFLEMRAALAGTPQYAVVDTTTNTILSGMAWDSKESAEQELTHYKESPAHQGHALEVREQKLDGKVSKEEATAFLKENGVQVEQVVLGESAKLPRDREREYGDKPRPEDLEWDDEGELVEQDWSYFDERASSDLESDLYVKATPEGHYAWFYDFSGADYEKALKKLEGSYWGDQVLEKEKELREEYASEFDAGDGQVDQNALIEKVRKEMRDYVDGELLDAAREAAQESHAEDEYAERKYTESETGYDLIGSDGNGEWWCPDTQKSYSGSIEEAKIKLLADMIEEGVVEGDTASAIQEADINWRSPAPTLPSHETLKKKARAYVKANAKELRAQAEATVNDWHYYGEPQDGDAPPTEEDFTRKMEWLAEDAVSAAYLDPTNRRNTITARIRHALLGGTVTGNDVKGYQFDFSINEGDEKTVKLESKTMAEAQAEAIRHLVEKRLITPKQAAALPAAEGAPPALPDPNAPTGRASWASHVVDGPKENYREILLTLPGTEGKPFTYDTHFRGHKNFVAHLRVTDRVDANGKKTLFVEELQSDWHQQGRERGYDTAELEARREEITAQIDAADKAFDEARERFNNAPDGSDAASAAGKEVDAARAKLSELQDELSHMRGAVPDAPYKQTEAWAALAMKRMLRLAVEQGYDQLAWSPAEVHVDRWGTDSIGWVKVTESVEYHLVPTRKGVSDATPIFQTRADARDWLSDQPTGKYRIEERKTDATGFLVGSVEQQGGNADGVDIEGLARMRGQLLERRGERVTTKEELHKVIASTLHRERNERSLESLTDQLWKEMQEKETGAKFPRKEGMEFFYDNALPRKVVPGILKKLDKEAKVTTTQLDTSSRHGEFGAKPLEVWAVPLTPKLKEEIAKGFSLFQEGENDPRGRITFGRHGVSIDLLKKADRTTFLHETGHLYLEILADLATGENAPPEAARDFQTTLEWLGVKDRSEIKRDQHEQWARGFEAYLMEGKAPTPALREAFARFKTWLVEIYRELRNLRVTLTPEVRAVFDRLVATEEEIAQAQGGLSPPLFENAEAFGMTGPQAERYRAALERARISAEEDLTRKAMAEIRERESVEYQARHDEVEFQVRAQVDVLPVYRALDKLLDKASGLKVQREGAITTMGFKKLPDSLTRYRGMFSDDGVHPDILAEGFGFENGEAMLNAIAKAVPKDDLVEQLTEQRMRALFPSLFDEGRIQAEAEAAVRNEDRAKVLRLELQHLASNDLAALKEGVRRVTRRVPPPKAVKAQAARILGGQAVRDIKPHLYEKAERAAGKEAGEALAAGDFERAFDAKQRELLNNALYRAALAAKETVRKSLTDFKKLRESDAELAKSRDMDMVNTARAILAAFGLGPVTDKPAESYLAAIERHDSDTYQTVKAIFDSATQRTGQFPAIAFDDFVAMRDTVKAIWELSRDSRELEIDGRKVELSTAKAELFASIAKIAPSADRERPGLDRKIEDKDRRWYGLRGIMSRLRRMESWVDEMDGGNLSGAFRKYLWTPVSEAIGRYRDARKTTLEKYLALVKTLDGLTSKKNITAQELTDGKAFVFKDKAHLLGAMLHTGNLSNKSKLVGGMKWGGTNEDLEVDFQRWDAFVKRMHSEGILTKADYDFMQKVWDLFEEQKPEAQKVHKKLYGFYFNEITADEIETPFGRYRGGYVPAIADSEVVEDAAIREEKNNLEKANNSFMFPTAGRGFTKKRVEQYMAPLIMDLRFVPQQLDRVLRFIHIEPAVKQASRIAMAQDFRKALSTVDPTAGAEMLIPWLQRSAQQMVETPMEGWGGKATAKFFRGMRTRTGMQVMFANVTNTLQQFTGITIAAVKVKPRHLRNALWSYVRAPGQLAKEAGELSELMRSRMDHQMTEMREVLNELLVDPKAHQQAIKFAQKHVYFMQSATQNVVDVVVWHGAYDQAVEEGLNQQEAVRSADSAVRLTQGSMAPEDISRFETGNAFVRAFTMFYSYFNMQANLLGTEFANTIRQQGLKNGSGRLLYVYFLGFAIPAMLSELLVRAMSGKGLDEDDDDQYLDDAMSAMFESQARNFTAFFPAVGQIANAGFNALNNKWYDDRISTSPAIAMLESGLGGTVKNVAKLASGEDINGKRATRDLLTLLGLISGLPLAPLSRPIGYGIDLSTGDADPTGPIDMTRGFITGKSGKQK